MRAIAHIGRRGGRLGALLPSLVAALLPALLLGGCITDPELKQPESHAPLRLDDGWSTSTPEAEGIDPAALNAAYESFFSTDRYQTGVSLLVLRNGKIISEAYCRDPRDAGVRRNIKSCTKSITSLLIGIALDRGLLTGLDQRVYDVIPEYFDDNPLRRRITIGQALTMRTGIDYDNDEQTEDLVVDEPESSLRFILSRPMAFTPGTRFHYSDGNPQLLAGVLQRVTGMSVEEFARRELFGPLGITDVSWEKGKDGINYGGFGIYLKPRDMARIGQLMLQRGLWNGRRIISEEWVAQSTAIHADQDEGPYGYYWWIKPEYGAYTAAGHGGNYIYVLPARNMVIVLTAMPYTDGVGVTSGDLEDLVQTILDGTH